MLQILVNAIVTGTLLALGAIGLTLIFGILKFANIAHASYITLGAYFTYVLSDSLGLNFGFSVIVSASLVGLIAILFQELIFKRVMASEEFGGLTPVIASLGLFFVLDHLGVMLWGPRPKTYSVSYFFSGIVEFFGARITYIQIIIIITTIAGMFCFHILLRKTKLGKAMRAVSDNPSLAQSCGISLRTIVHSTWFISAMFAAVGGSLVALDTQVYPKLGFSLLLPLFAVVTVGGIGNVYGAMLGGLLVGFAQNVILAIDFGYVFTLGSSSYFINPNYKTAVSFIIIIITLIFRPSGIFKGTTRR